MARGFPMLSAITDGLVFSFDCRNFLAINGGLSVLDSSGNNLNLSRINSPIFSDNPPKFTNTGAFQGFSHPAGNLPVGNDEYTIESWVRLGQTFSGTRFIWLSGGSNSGIVYGIGTRGFSWVNYIGPGLGNFVSNSPGYNTNWNHITGTRNAVGELQIYVNGIAGNSITRTDSLIASSPTIFGNISSGTFDQFIGDIALINVYRRALSAAEVLHNFTVGKKLFKL